MELSDCHHGVRVFIKGCGFNCAGTVVSAEALIAKGWKMSRPPKGSEVLVLPDSLEYNAIYLPARVLERIENESVKMIRKPQPA